MTDLSWILVEAAVLCAGANSLRYDIDVDARVLVLVQTEVGTIPCGRGSLRGISPLHRDGRRREIDRLIRRRHRTRRLEPRHPAVRHLDSRLSLGPGDRRCYRGHSRRVWHWFGGDSPTAAVRSADRIAPIAIDV